MTPVVIATCSEFPTGDEDGDALLAALAAHGVRARWQVWNDPRGQWDDALVVVRSTWDYTLDRDAFVRWARSVPRLANPADVIAWNSDKTYLRDLAVSGVAIVPTVFTPPGGSVELPTSGEFVVKPSVGAGSRGVGRFRSDEGPEARAHAAALHSMGRVAMVQPYLATVDISGEAALIYVDGSFSHAITKGSMLPAGVVHPVESWARYVPELIEPRTPSEAELALGERVVSMLRAHLGYDLLYARVDLLPSPDGPVVIELELTEPSLFLGYSEHAADRFAGAIAARA